VNSLRFHAFACVFNNKDARNAGALPAPRFFIGGMGEKSARNYGSAGSALTPKPARKNRVTALNESALFFNLTPTIGKREINE